MKLKNIFTISKLLAIHSHVSRQWMVLKHLNYVCICHEKQWFFQFEIIINIFVSYYRFIWIPMLWVYGLFLCLFFQCGRRLRRQIYRRQILTPKVDPCIRPHISHCHIFITFVQRGPNDFAVGPRLYTCTVFTGCIYILSHKVVNYHYI